MSERGPKRRSTSPKGQPGIGGFSGLIKPTAPQLSEAEQHNRLRAEARAHLIVLEAKVAELEKGTPAHELAAAELCAHRTDSAAFLRRPRKETPDEPPL